MRGTNQADRKGFRRKAFSAEEGRVSHDIKDDFPRKSIDGEFDVIEIPVKEINVSRQAAKTAVDIFGEDFGDDLGGMMRLLCRGTMGAIKRGMVLDLPRQPGKVLIPLAFEDYGGAWAVVHLDPVKHQKTRNRYVMITCLPENHRTAREACVAAGVSEDTEHMLTYVIDGEDESWGT